MRDRWKSVGPLGGGADGRFVLDSSGLTLPGPFAGSLLSRPLTEPLPRNLRGKGAR